jgi:N-acyl-D-aspartate/D-glutamate deacylase
MSNHSTSHYDVLIKHARIVDGTGNPWFYGDVALAGETIAAVAPPNTIPEEQAAQVVDAAGHVVCPGFVDIISHSILPLMVDGRSLSKIAMGVTTEVMGEGWTPAPYGGALPMTMPKHQFASLMDPAWEERIKTWTHFRDWLEAMVEEGVSVNVGSFLGGGSLRRYAMGMAMRPPTGDELATMKRITAESMEQGAFGVSFALIYPPSNYAETDEIVEIAKVISQHKGIYITHLRSEAFTFLEALEEAIQIGQRANVPVEIYHLKAAGKQNWWKMAAAIERINQARAEGVDMTADVYTYTAMGTGLSSVLPPFAQADDKFYENVKDPAMRAKIKAEALNPTSDWEALVKMCGLEGVMPIGFMQEENKQYVGKHLGEIAEMMGKDWPDAVMDLFASEEQRIATIYFSMSEQNMHRKLQAPWTTISTDAGGLDPAWAAPTGLYHPRAYGTYTRVLGKYVREEKVLTLEDAVRKMSSALCDRLGLRNRGQIREGFQADVVIFDPETVGDRATFTDPHQLSVGVRDVWVNGTQVFQDGTHTGAKPGQIVGGRG